MKMLGNIILDGSLSLYMWGKNVGTKRAIPKTKQAGYRQFVKDYVCQEKDKTDKRKTLSALHSEKTECELHYEDVMNRRGLTDKERIKECKKRFSNIKKKNVSDIATEKEKSSKDNTKKKNPPKGNIPIWCSAALAAAEGIGRILRMPLDYALGIQPQEIDLKLPRKPEEENDDRLMVVGDVHNDPAYMTKLKQRIKNALDDPRNGNEKIIVACENRLYDEKNIALLRIDVDLMDEHLKRAYGENKDIKFFYETLENHVGKEAMLKLNATLRYSGDPSSDDMTKILSEKTFGSPPKSYARAILEAYKDIGGDNFIKKLDTKDIEYQTKTEQEASYLKDFLSDQFPRIGKSKDILDITDYKRVSEDISLYEDFKDNDRVIFKKIDKKHENFHTAFENMLDGINSIVEGAEELRKEDFTNIDQMLKECFSDIINVKDMRLQKKFIPDYYNRKNSFGRFFKEKFENMIGAIVHKNMNVLKHNIKVLNDPEQRENIKITACTHMRSLAMLEEGRALAKEHPNSEVIMFMGQYHSYDLQIDAPHANFNERYKIDNGDTVLDDSEA